MNPQKSSVIEQPTLPESAVELAARAMKEADLACHPKAEPFPDTYYRRLAAAALPAIRDAVVGEFLRLADRWDVRADLEDMEGGPFFDESERDQLLACATEIRTLAALTEQENRND